MLKRIVLFLLISLSFMSCAYFNTFYNAEQYYKKAYKETRENRTEKITGSERSNYQKAVEKSQKLIEFYPNSKYVDDALLLMGKAYYHQHDYLKAERRLNDLIQDYPNSNLLSEAMLYLAKTHMALEVFDQAEEEFKRLSKSPQSKELKSETYFYLGKLYDRRALFEKSLEAYQEAVKSANDEFIAEALFALGVSYDTLGIYDKAYETFQKVQNHDPTSKRLFVSQLRYAQAQKKFGEIDQSIHTLEDLLGTETDNNRLPIIRLEIADGLALKRNIDEAIIAYQDVIRDYPRTVHSAKACYALGKIFETKRRDYSKALEQFNQVKKEYVQSEYADSSEIKARDITRMQALEHVILLAQKGESGDVVVADAEKVEEDTLSAEHIYAVMDSISNDSLRTVFLTQLWGRAFVDSILTDPEVFKQQRERERLYKIDDEGEKEEEVGLVDWAKWIRNGRMPSYSDLEEEIQELKVKIKKPGKVGLAENPELKSFKVEEVDKNRFLLAEIYWFRFSLFDSALVQYRRIVDEYPESPYAARSLYNLGYLEKEVYQDSILADSVYQKLISTYPRSAEAKAAKSQRHMDVTQRQYDMVDEEFIKAENTLLDQNDPRQAFGIYQSVLEKHPKSDWAARALYSMGWICEFHLDSLQLAYMLYDSLLEKYPESVYAKRVQSKVRAVQSAEQDKKKEESMALKQPVRLEAVSDSAAFAATEGVLPSISGVADTLTVESTSADSVIQNPSGRTKRRIELEPELRDETVREEDQKEGRPPDDYIRD